MSTQEKTTTLATRTSQSKPDGQSPFPETFLFSLPIFFFKFFLIVSCGISRLKPTRLVDIFSLLVKKKQKPIQKIFFFGERRRMCVRTIEIVAIKLLVLFCFLFFFHFFSRVCVGRPKSHQVLTLTSPLPT